MGKNYLIYGFWRCIFTLIEVYEKTTLDKYKIIVKTGSSWWNGTHGTVKIQIFGSKGRTGWRTLNNSFIDFDKVSKSRLFLSKFRRGNVATFEIDSADLGEL